MSEIFNNPMTEDIPRGYLVVSEGTEKVARNINKRRKNNGVRLLDIVTVPYVLAADGLPIKATRVAEGEIDRQGSILGDVLVAVGTTNRVKLEAVRDAFQRVFGSVVVKGYKVDTGVSAQPKGRETITGARNRAQNAADACPRDFHPHFFVGIEAGLFKVPQIRKYMDVQYCAVADRGGHFTYGHSPGFYYPPEFDKMIEAGEEVSDIIEELYGIKNIGKKNGAIGFLTDNAVTRKDLLVASVLMALVPRIKRVLYP